MMAEPEAYGTVVALTPDLPLVRATETKPTPPLAEVTPPPRRTDSKTGPLAAAVTIRVSWARALRAGPRVRHPTRPTLTTNATGDRDADRRDGGRRIEPDR